MSHANEIVTGIFRFQPPQSLEEISAVYLYVHIDIFICIQHSYIYISIYNSRVLKRRTKRVRKLVAPSIPVVVSRPRGSLAVWLNVGDLECVTTGDKAS